MNTSRPSQAGLILQQAVTALGRGDRRTARILAARAARLDPKWEDPWLVLAAAANPQASISYLKLALQINPHSTRALEGLKWAQNRLKEHPPALPLWSGTNPPLPEPAARSSLTHAAVPIVHPPAAPLITGACLKPRKAVPPEKKGLHGCWFIAVGAMLVLVTFSLAASFFLPQSMFSKPVYQGQARPVGVIIKPSLTPTDTVLSPMLPTHTRTASPTPTLIPSPTLINPTFSGISPLPSTQTPTVIPTSPVTLPTPVPFVTKSGSFPPSTPVNPNRWIEVNLTQQRSFAFEGEKLVKSFVVSTGTYQHPTVTGTFKIYVKYRTASMSGPGYFLANVPFVMYFYKGYGLHGTYWHNNFGSPMSHGCVNFRTIDAGWLFDWTSVGTVVKIHY